MQPLKVCSHMRGVDTGWGGRKIGFNNNYYMRSHIRGCGAEAELEQNPLRNKRVQHPIFRVLFETAGSKPSSSTRNGRSARVRGAGISKSALLRSATALHICELSFMYTTGKTIVLWAKLMSFQLQPQIYKSYNGVISKPYTEWRWSTQM